jgi:hypothetical protein
MPLSTAIHFPSSRLPEEIPPLRSRTTSAWPPVWQKNLPVATQNGNAAEESNEVTVEM